MQVSLAYLGVVLIWSTTPLAIKWSNHSITYIASASLRMGLSALILLLLLKLMGRSIFPNQAAVKSSAAASFGIFPGMALVYWSAQYINSGTMALVFAIQPFVTGLISYWLLGDNPLSRRKVLALAMAFTGLGIIFAEQIALGDDAWKGVVGILIATSIIGISSVLLKRYPGQKDALCQTAGSLIFSLPFFTLSWFLLDGNWAGILSAEQWSMRSVSGLLYLATMGSIVGFALYYYLLANLAPTSVALISMITPGLALWVGQKIDGEPVTASLVMGGAIIVVALALYQGVLQRAWRYYFVEKT